MPKLWNNNNWKLKITQTWTLIKRVTYTKENHSIIEYLIIYQIVFSITPDERHDQTFIKLGNRKNLKYLKLLINY